MSVQIAGQLLYSLCVPGYHRHDTNWLATTPGEILHTTHEEARIQPCICNGGESKSSDSIIYILLTAFSKTQYHVLPMKLLTMRGKWAVSAHSTSHSSTHSDSCFFLHHFQQLLGQVCCLQFIFLYPRQPIVVQIVSNLVEYDLLVRPTCLPNWVLPVTLFYHLTCLDPPRFGYSHIIILSLSDTQNCIRKTVFGSSFLLGFVAAGRSTGPTLFQVISPGFRCRLSSRSRRIVARRSLCMRLYCSIYVT